MRLIDVDKLVLELKNPDLVNVFPIVFKVISEQKIIETTEHGKWVKRNDEWFDFLQCSVCGNKRIEEVPYCPYCGAKMDGELNAKKEKS